MFMPSLTEFAWKLGKDALDHALWQNYKIVFVLLIFIFFRNALIAVSKVLTQYTKLSTKILKMMCTIMNCNNSMWRTHMFILHHYV